MQLPRPTLRRRAPARRTCLSAGCGVRGASWGRTDTRKVPDHRRFAARPRPGRTASRLAPQPRSHAALCPRRWPRRRAARARVEGSAPDHLVVTLRAKAGPAFSAEVEADLPVDLRCAVGTSLRAVRAGHDASQHFAESSHHGSFKDCREVTVSRLLQLVCQHFVRCGLLRP